MSAKKERKLLIFFCLTFPEPSELKALDRRDVGGDGSLLHHVVEHAADLLIVAVVVGADVQLHKDVHAVLPHHLPAEDEQSFQVVGVVHYLLAKPLELSQLVYEGVLRT